MKNCLKIVPGLLCVLTAFAAGQACAGARGELLVQLAQAAGDAATGQVPMGATGIQPPAPPVPHPPPPPTATTAEASSGAGPARRSGREFRARPAAIG